MGLGAAKVPIQWAPSAVFAVVNTQGGAPRGAPPLSAWPGTAPPGWTWSEPTTHSPGTVFRPAQPETEALRRSTMRG